MRYVTPLTPMNDGSCGECLKRVMAEQGVTVAELSRRTGLSERCIRYLRAGKSQGNFFTWRKIANVLGKKLVEEVIDAG